MKTHRNITPNFNSNTRVGLILAGIVIASISAMALWSEIRATHNTTNKTFKATTQLTANLGLNWVNKSFHRH
jgi:hypothetical protein